MPASACTRLWLSRHALLAAVALAALSTGCGGSAGHGASAPGSGTPADTATGPASQAAAPSVAPPAPPPPPRLLVSASARAGKGWRVIARVRGRPAAWIAQSGGATLMLFDQALTHLTLHTGSNDGGGSGWRYGDHITPREIHLLIAAFNGGFKLTYANVGFLSGRRVAVPLKPGLASIVTYSDGTSNIGAWHAGVPSSRKEVFSVLQNQQLLVDRGRAAESVASCILSCWGDTIGGRTSVARSGLGITAAGQLLWAGGEELLPADLAAALVSAGAVRALELDINPYWVAGYIYPHSSSGPRPVPVVPGQHGIAGELLEGDARDFLAVVAN